MRAPALTGVLVLALTAPAHAQLFGSPTLNIVADPATATIYKIKAQDNSLVQLGVGNAKLKLEKDDPNTIVVRQEGYRDMTRSFPRDADYKDKTFTVLLSKRVVQLTALPYDARILVNGEFKGNRSLEVDVDEGQATTVELTKAGFATIKRVYQWEKGGDLPPVQERIELVDRRVSITSDPEGVELFTGDARLGVGDADFIIRQGSCARLNARLMGWMPETVEYCNKDGQPEPPLNYRIVLKGRVVKVSAPEGSLVLANYKQAGIGGAQVQIPSNACTEVIVSQPGFLSFRQSYCARPGDTIPPEEIVTLKQDASYSASEASDQANANITVEVGKNVKEEQAWKLLSSIVLNYFDVLENSDSQTGYLRTAWQIKSWGVNNVNDRVVRTRVILKRVSDSPLRYSLKIVSEKNKDGLGDKWSTQDDENYEAWDRILNTYKDVISEAQTRLK